MYLSKRLLAGSAIWLLMAAPTAYAAGIGDASMQQKNGQLMLAQADAPAEPSAECPAGTVPSANGCAPEQQAPIQQEEAAPVEPQAPAAEQPAEVPPVEPAPPPQEVAPTTPQAAIEQPSEPTAPPPAEPPASEAPPVEPERLSSPPQEVAPTAPPAAIEQPSEPAAPSAEPQPAEQQPVAPETSPVSEQQPPEPQPAPEGTGQGAPKDAVPAENTQTTPAPEAAPQQPTQEEPVEKAPAAEVPGAEVPTAETPSEQPAPQIPQQGKPSEVPPESVAPLLDSQKEVPQTPEGQPAQSQTPAEPVPVPQSDVDAQQLQLEPAQVQQEIRSIVEERGERIDFGQKGQDRSTRRRDMYERRDEGKVVQEFNDNRTIVEINNHIYVRSNDEDRLVRNDDSVYYEELRNGRVREVVERRDGSRVVTIRNRYGDVVRRMRLLPDGTEYVMVYVPEDRYDMAQRFEDPGRDLPPMRLTIPVREYIFEAEPADGPQAYYTFLAEPPVERVERLYSLDEVRYSARIRDKVRRIDLDTVEFEFGSANISESEIGNLESLASAILEMLANNPGETFLLEGHTDAVGSENANLALSDRRAESVAIALTNVFNIPPETMVTQGYGEQYLKVRTQKPERVNRRVSVRRITPLVTPVAKR